MHVEMGHSFTTIGTIIDDQAETGFLKSFLLRDGLRHMDQVSQKSFISGSARRDTRDLLLGNDEQVNRGLGIDVMKGQALVVLVGDPGRDFAGDYLGEYRAHWIGLAVEGGFQEPRGFDKSFVQHL